MVPAWEVDNRSLPSLLTSSPLFSVCGDAKIFLLADANPLRGRLRFTRRSGKSYVGHLLYIRNGDFTSTQTANKTDYRRVLGCGVEGGANFRGQDAACIRRAQREVAIDDAYAREPR